MEEHDSEPEQDTGGAGNEKTVRYGVFIAAIIMAAAVLYILANLASTSKGAVSLAVVVGLLALLYLIARLEFVLRLEEFQRAVISRFGKVNRVGGPGWTVLFPPAEQYTIVDLRTKTIDIPPQDVITKDNIEVRIDAVIYLKVNKDNQSIINSVVEVEDYQRAAGLFVKGMIRNLAGTMTLHDLVTSTDRLNDALKKELEGLSRRWGVSVEEAAITEIIPPAEVQDARNQLEVSAQKRRQREEQAEAQKAEITAVREAAEHLSDKALAYYYVKALEKLGEGQSSKIIFPMELTELAKAVSGDKLPEATVQSLLRKYAPVVKRIAAAPAGRKRRWRK